MSQQKWCCVSHEWFFAFFTFYDVKNNKLEIPLGSYEILIITNPVDLQDRRADTWVTLKHQVLEFIEDWLKFICEGKNQCLICFQLHFKSLLK